MRKKERPLYKPNLKPSESGTQTAFVVDRANYIEYQLKKIITAYIRPEKTKEKFTNDILLNSSVIDFGGKIKLFTYISTKEGWDNLNDELMTIAKIRNGFAHSDTVTGKIAVMMSGDQVISTSSYMTLDSLTPSGKFVEKDREEALQEFTDNYVFAKKYLDNVIDKLEKGSRIN